MFGAFKPSAPLLGGLLWKIPWKLSTPQKLRHRRRLRRVDNIVATLDNALRRQAISSAIPQRPTPPSNAEPAELPVEDPSHGKATPSELAQTGEGQRLLTAAQRAEIEKRRHGRGPRQGEWVPEFDSNGVKIPGGELLGSKALREGTMKVLERWKAEMPTEAEMLPKDKYTMFDRKAKGYRKGVHKLPKWTRKIHSLLDHLYEFTKKAVNDEIPTQKDIAELERHDKTRHEMPVDYSKWDALELSDDSDIEVHPNVDKRSFIRAKQNQIHQDRQVRKHRITTLRYERVINDGLLSRIDALLKSLEGHRKDVTDQKDASDADEVVFDALMEVSSDGSLGPDQPPTPPEGVHTQQEQPSYSKMMAALVDQVKETVEKGKDKESSARYEAYLKEVGQHQKKVQGLQRDLAVELTKLEKEEGMKITSESIHEGFNSSHVAKGMPAATGAAAATKTGKSAVPELLNPRAATEGGAETPGSEADIEEGSVNAAPGEDNDDDIEATALGKKFAAVKFGDYATSLQFIGSNPAILAERETDGLLVEAFNAQSNAKNKKQEEYARQCVHQALLIQYCRQLGRDGVGLFFKRIQTQGHQARKMFLDDVNSTYARIRDRTAELAKERENEGEGEGVETIQLHAVDPGTQINIVTPPALSECTTDDEKIARQIFDTFPPGLQRALESGSLERVNEVLGKMSVDEAEQVVEQLGNGGMLSLEEGVIDATTDEGRKTMEEIERTKKMPGQQGDSGRMEELEDPGMD